MADQGFDRVPQTAVDLLRNAIPDDGMPTWEETMRKIAAHIDSMSSKKFGPLKPALFPTANQVAEIKDYLEKVRRGDSTSIFIPSSLNPNRSKDPTTEIKNKAAQWRHSRSDKYRLDDFGSLCVKGGNKGEENGYVVPREQIHNVLVWAHRQTRHGGRDKMYAEIRKRYSTYGFTKEFILAWAACCNGHSCRARRKGPKSPMTPPVNNNTTAAASVPVPVPAVPVPVPAAPASPVPTGPVPILDLLADPAYSLPQAVLDPEINAVWDEVVDWEAAAAELLWVPEQITGLFTPAELGVHEPPSGLVEPAMIPPAAADVEVDLEFDAGQYRDFSAGDMDCSFGSMDFPASGMDIPVEGMDISVGSLNLAAAEMNFSLGDMGFSLGDTGLSAGVMDFDADFDFDFAS